jgi:imidazolonepropionase-like amidohydrolase
MWWVVDAALAADLTRAELEARGRALVEPVAAAPAPPVVLAGGTVMTAAGDAYVGYVVLQDGRITAAGEGPAPEVPGARVLDVRGRFVTPALIDTHSHLGVYASPDASAHGDGNEATAPTTPGVWAEHSILPQDPGFERAVAGGVATMQILPGSANLVGGRGVVVRAIPARGGRAMRFPGAPETVKMACGENPKRVYGGKGGAPSTRMGNLRGQREAFLGAEAYLRRWTTYDRELLAWRESHPDGAPEPTGKKAKKGAGAAEPPAPPDRDLDQDTLALILAGEALPQVHCYRADDMLSFLQLADEFGFQVRSFHHATDAYKIRDVLAARGVAASVWADWWGFKVEAYDAIPEGAALLTEAGGRAIVHSDSGIGIQRLNQEAAKAYAAGLRSGVAVTEDDALRWITANPAWALGIDAETGTIEAGKRADVVVWSAHPFSVYSRADLVFVDGALRWDADRPQVWSDLLTGQELVEPRGTKPAEVTP